METVQRPDVEPEVDQPGLRELREAMAHPKRQLPGRPSVRYDGIAGLNSAVSSVPDGMASGMASATMGVCSSLGAHDLGRAALARTTWNEPWT